MRELAGGARAPGSTEFGQDGFPHDHEDRGSLASSLNGDVGQKVVRVLHPANVLVNSCPQGPQVCETNGK